jgi:hypothetical protein
VRTVPTRVHLTGGNRPGYRGYWPYRPGPVSVPAGYQLVDFKHLGFEFKKLKNEEKSLKIFHDLLSLMVSIVFANFIRFSIICGQYKLKKNKKDKNQWPSKAHLGPTIGGGGQNIPKNLPVKQILTSQVPVRRPWRPSGRRSCATAPRPRFTAG